MAARAEQVGTRLALVGTVLYLSEWLVIPFVADVPTDDLGDDAAAIAAAYANHGTELAFIAVVLLGLSASAGWLAEAGAEVRSIVALDAASTVLFYSVVTSIGASVLACSAAMLLSGGLPRAGSVGWESSTERWWSPAASSARRVQATAAPFTIWQIR